MEFQKTQTINVEIMSQDIRVLNLIFISILIKQLLKKKLKNTWIAKFLKELFYIVEKHNQIDLQTWKYVRDLQSNASIITNLMPKVIRLYWINMAVKDI